MATGKMLNLGGIDNRPPKANQSSNRFRVARNIYPTPDGRIIPRYGSSEVMVAPGNIEAYLCLSRYNSNILAMTSYSGNLKLSDGSIFIPNSSNMGASPYPTYYTGSFLTNPFMSYRRNNTTYFLNTYNGTMTKYDGVEGSACGVDLPKVFSNSFSALGTKFVRVLQHKIDFDNNEPVGDFVQFPVLTGTTSVDIWTDGLNQTFGYSNIEYTSLGNDNYFKGGIDTFYDIYTDRIIVTNNTIQTGYASGNTVTGLVTTSGLKVGMKVTGVGVPANSFIKTIPTGNSITLANSSNTSDVYPGLPAGAITLKFPLDTNMNSDDRIGSYVFVAIKSSEMPSGITGYGLALKLVYQATSVDGPTLGFSRDVKYLNTDREWVSYTFPVSSLSSISWITYGTRNMDSVWASSSASGVYYFMDYIPSFPASTIGYQKTVTIPNPPTGASGIQSTCLNIFSPFLNDFIDISATRINPNSTQNFGGDYPFYCSTVYQDLLLLANDDLIWFSDTTLGGTFEMLNALNFIKVGDKEYGRVTSICGTQDFLVVCRERKNYYVNGNIATGNYRVQEIQEAEIGAWNNVSTMVIKDNVVMIAATGVYEISDGGKCIKISKNCPKNFSTYDNNNINEDVSFRLDGYVSSFTDGYGIHVFYDEYRELLVFMKIGINEIGTALVLHTASGEFYEWDGLIGVHGNKYAQCGVFINSQYILGSVDYTLLGTRSARLYEEDKFSALSYPATYPIKLYSSWLTAGEPSLEKLLLQLKMFGRIQSDGTTSSINVCHYKDWDISTKITNVAYYPTNTALSLDNQIQYSHKKRFNSDKVLAASVGFEVNTSNVTFELESFEVEFNPIQEGMKK